MQAWTWNEAILRDFLSFWTRQHQKRSNSGTLLQILNLTTSDTKQFCETSPFFEGDNMKTKQFCKTPMRFAFFPLHLSKVLRLPRKSDAISYEVLHLSCKIIFPKLKIWCSKMQPLRKSSPGPPNSSDEHVSCTAPAMRNASCHILCICPTPAIVFGNATKTLTFYFTFDKVHNPLRLPRETTSECPKVLHTRHTRQFFALLTSKCASCHNGLHFFDISTSKSGPNNFDMCCAPQRRALFRHLNFQKWPECAVYFWAFTCKSALRHNGVQFFISHLARWLRTRRFSEATCRPSGATNHRKNTVFCDFPTFSRAWIFFLLILSPSGLLSSSLLFSSLTLPISAFHLSILLEVWLLNFLRQLIFK